jgi:formylglycine-generating enzyme required for sulfatase activity
VDEIAWYANNSGRAKLDGTVVMRDPKAAIIMEQNGNRMHAVAAKQPNGFALYDMLGNVWEWVNDWAGVDYYAQSPEADPQGPQSGRLRVLRGGTWFREAAAIRASVRLFNPQDLRSTRAGFRCALDGMTAPGANQAK